MKKILVVVLSLLIVFIVGCEAMDVNQAPLIVVDDDLYIDVFDTTFSLGDHVTITDDGDGDMNLQSATVEYGGFEVTVVGEYVVKITVLDSEGVSSTETITIHVEDNTKPTISLFGGSEIQLRIGESYNEPGATVEDNYDSDLEYVVEGSVDTTTSGSYILEYYVVDANQNVSETIYRTVTVIHNAPVLHLTDVVATQNSVSFELEETDHEQIGEVVAIKLYQGESLIETLSDVSTREFNGLYSNTTYTIVATIEYDLNDGEGIQETDVVQNVVTLSVSEPLLNLHTIVPTKDGVTFMIDYTDDEAVGEITMIELYQGDTMVQALTDLTLREFTGLYSNTTYTIKVTTTYDLYDGNGEQERLVHQEVVTLALQAPTLSIINVNPTVNSVGFYLDIIDVDEVGEVKEIIFLKGDTVVHTLTDLSIREVGSLYSDTEYTISVNYQYDLNDGNGIQLLTEEYVLSTLANGIPLINMINIDLQSDSISFELEETDPSNVGAVESIDLIQGDTVVESLADLSVRTFTNLEPEHVYSIKVSFVYNLNDGSGDVEIVLVERRELMDSGIARDGDFSGIPNATFSYDSGGWAGLAEATAIIQDEELVVDITDSGDEYWAIQYTFDDFEFKANTNYVLSFEASSTLERYIGINVGIRHTTTQWTSIAQTSVPLVNDMIQYEFAFTTVHAVTELAQIVFELGAALQEDGSYLETTAHTIIFDNIIVYEENDITADIEYVYNWFAMVRHDNGLHTSSIPGQVFSLYDNALAAMVYTMLGEYEYAADIFDYFDTRILTELQDDWGGFVQIRDLNGNYGDIGNRWLGDNAWFLTAIHYYHQQTGTTEYQALADALEVWILSLQNADGGLNSGYDPTGFMQYPVTEAMIDSYNAVSGYTTYHQELETYLLQTRVDTQYGVFMAWPGHPTYQYSLDTIGWAYLGMPGWSDEILAIADQLFLFEENGIYGYCADVDKDTIFTELTLTMAAAYNKAGNTVVANSYIEYMETLFFDINPTTKGLPYTTSRATGYADFPLWETVETDAHLSGNAWYIFSKMRLNPMKVGLEGKPPFNVE